MGSRLTIRTEDFLPAENHEWLGSAHGTQEMESGTLDGDDWLTAFPSGVIPSGVVLAKNADGTRLVPFVTASGTSNGTAVGHLFTTTIIAAGQDTTVPVYWHGRVRVAKLPTGSTYDSTVKADLPQIRYV